MFGGLGGQVAEPGRLIMDLDRRFGTAYGGQKARDELDKIKALERKIADDRQRFEIAMSKKFTPESVEVMEERFKGREGTFKDWVTRRSDRKELDALENHLKHGGGPVAAKRQWAFGKISSLSKEDRTKALERWKENKILPAELLDELSKVGTISREGVGMYKYKGVTP